MIADYKWVNMSYILLTQKIFFTIRFHSRAVYLIHNYISDHFHSAYKTGHSCETVLLSVYNDIVTYIGRGNGVMLVILDLLDLPAAF